MHGRIKITTPSPAPARALFISMCTCAAAAASPAHADISVWDFNVFSRSTIGSQGQGYGSDFEGASGSVQDAYFSNFGMKTVMSSSPSLPAAFYGGGNFTLNSGSVNSGGMYAAGNVNLYNASISGDVHAGGSLNGSSGSISGNLFLGGSRNTTGSLTISGAVSTQTPYAAPLDLIGVSNYFHQTSSFAASLAPTTNYTNQWGQIIIHAAGERTIVNLSPTDYINAWGIRIDGAGTVVVNVGGTTISTGSKTWSYEGGASSRATLLNFYEATTLTLSGGHNVNILATQASTTFSSGVINGTLVAGSLQGAGQVNWVGSFTGSSVIPSPATIPFMSAGLTMICRRRRG
ncbi:MAG TPA: choice-of-anchor A family protein [Phycisphaerales bacterium]|nr:choice-of-anchor A family protein [Phycisphaerales bacterium]